MDTLVLGASDNPERVSYQAILRLRKAGHHVHAIGLRPGRVGDVDIQTGTPPLEHIHTITLYMNAQRQEPLYDYMLALRPQRIIFNPGTENPALAKLAHEQGIHVEVACTLVLLSLDSYAVME